MKNLFITLITLLAVTFSTNLLAEGPSVGCNWNSWFEYPSNGNQYDQGCDMYVKVKPQKYQDIEYMKLYIDGHYIRKESNYPYEWCKSGSSGDTRLRNMSPGNYRLKVKIKDRCGYEHEEECNFEVKSGYGNGGGNCDWDSWFEYPNNGHKYDNGSDIYCKVRPQKYQDIEYMKLYINGQFIRKESSYPYEWCKSNSSSDHQLRNMQAGHYRVKVKIKDRCGYEHEKECNFEIKGGNTNACIDPSQINQNAACNYIYNPVCGCNNVTYSNSCVAENAGVQNWTSGPCSGGGNTTGNCDWDSWFEYPNNGHKYDFNSDVYVKVKPNKYQDVEYMKLYINGQFIRKESSYPYEWCKSGSSSDHQLRNMQAGHYTVKVKIKDRCGNEHEKECRFEIKGHNNGGGNGNCDWNSWFEYPSNGQKYNRGSNIYCKVKPNKYQDIEYMKLYVNGQYVRKESHYPYEWCKSNSSGDNQLRNMQPGHYTVKVKIKDKCGYEHEKECNFEIKH